MNIETENSTLKNITYKYIYHGVNDTCNLI